MHSYNHVFNEVKLMMFKSNHIFYNNKLLCEDAFSSVLPPNTCKMITCTSPCCLLTPFQHSYDDPRKQTWHSGVECHTLQLDIGLPHKHNADSLDWQSHLLCSTPKPPRVVSFAYSCWRCTPVFPNMEKLYFEVWRLLMARQHIMVRVQIGRQLTVVKVHRKHRRRENNSCSTKLRS